MTTRVGRTSSVRSSLPRVVSRVLTVAAILLVLNALVPHHGLLRAVVHGLSVAYSWVFLDVSGSFGKAAFLVILAVALDRRKRAAWIVLVIFLATQVLVNATIALTLLADPRELPQDRLMIAQGVSGVLMTLVWISVLLWARGEFYARSPRGNIIRAGAVLLAGLGITAAVGAALILMVPATTRRPRDRLEWLWHRLFIDPGSAPVGMPSWVSGLIGLLEAASLLSAFWLMLRSQAQLTAQESRGESVLRSLVAESPDDSLAYFATRRDKAWVFAPEADAAIAYRVVLGTCLAAGDPVGPRQHWPAAIKAWLANAREYGWTPAAVGTSEAGALAYAEHAGMHVMKLGDEAILEASRFHLDAPELKPVRHAVERLHRLGYRVRIRRHADIEPAELSRLVTLADRWRDTETERGFSMALGRLGDPLDGGCLMVEALFGEGTQRDGTDVAGLLSFVPWGGDGWSLDVMRRNPEADNGVTELMVSGLMASDLRRVSLNFAMFRSAFEQGAQLGAGPLLRLWRRLLLIASRWWQMETLYRSNLKYQPQWVPRFLSFEDAADIALVGAATGVAEGFLDLPKWLAPPPTESPAPSAEEVAALMPAPVAPQVHVSDQVRVRRAKRERLLAAGIDPYPPDFRPTAGCREASGECAVAGRVLRLRDHGGVVFIDLQDSTGRVQVLFSRDRVADLARLTADVDLGDHLGVWGVTGTSRTGTPSLLASGWRLTGKALRPLPDKHRGLADAEARVRRRYLDLVVNPRAAELVRARSAILGAVRRTLTERGYLEVETPILQTLHGGANARPFRTHINAYDLDLYLRIAPELYLKRLMVGGLDRVFEMGRNFRNEGVDATHNPEFSMLEAYQAYADYTVMREVVQEIITNAVIAATGSTTIEGTDRQGVRRTVDLAGEWRVITVNGALGEALGSPITADTDRAALAGHARAVGIDVAEGWNRGEVLLELYEHLCESRTVEPTFYCDFPAEVSPLTRPHRDDARLAERWDLVCFGAEIGTAYSELVDPVVQRQRLTEQSLQAYKGDVEAMELDEDFLEALEHGMPPSGGLGMGLDRLVMMITNTTIREAMTFPLVRTRGVNGR